MSDQEMIPENRSHILLYYLFDNLSFDRSSITEYDRLVYATSYNQISSIRAANKWYQAFPQDAVDSKSYQKLSNADPFGVLFYIGCPHTYDGKREQRILWNPCLLFGWIFIS